MALAAKRGRPSTAALSVVAMPTERIERQLPPAELTEEQRGVWFEVVEAEPADWFSPSTRPLLAQYCRHVVQARRIGELIEDATADPDLKPKDYDRLLKMQERESRAVSGLATKMRIAQQSTRTHRGNARTSTGPHKPWEN